jgi:hypothetical protein
VRESPASYRRGLEKVFDSAMPIVTIDQLVRVVEPRSPDRRAIDFAAVEMRDGQQNPPGFPGGYQ